MGTHGMIANIVADSNPRIARGRVWCLRCSHSETVDPAQALLRGWPHHCGVTMTIDSPEERRASCPIAC